MADALRARTPENEQRETDGFPRYLPSLLRTRLSAPPNERRKPRVFSATRQVVLPLCESLLNNGHSAARRRSSREAATFCSRT
jgi:hypothetical protein